MRIFCSCLKGHSAGKVAEQALREPELFEEAGMPAGLPASVPAALSVGHPCLQVWLPLPVGGVYTAPLLGN